MQLDDRNIGRFLAKWHEVRQKARTDLLYLCNNILGYKDVSQRVHGPILDALQKFPGCVDYHKTVKDFVAAQQEYKPLFEPLVPHHLLEGSRHNLILFPRGHLKTSVATTAHAIQWVINYRNLAVLVSSGTGEQIEDFVREIKKHFLYNEVFRFHFPEFCPKEGSELGNSTRFSVKCADNPPKEGTFNSMTIGKVVAGPHWDVQKHDDLVSKETSRTPGQIEEVKFHFGMMKPLMQTYEIPGKEPRMGWQDVSGTLFDFSDLHQTIVDDEEKRKREGKPPIWNVVLRSAAPNWPEGPFLWPERLGYKGLKDIEDSPVEGPAVLYPQYLMKPITLGQGLIEHEDEIRWIPRYKLDELLPRLNLFATLDLAGMDTGSLGLDNDYSALSVGGFGRDGRLYVERVLHGRPDVFAVIDWIFDTFDRYPRLIKLKIEKEAHARVLLPFLKREMGKRGKWLPIDPQPRDNQQSKKDKIRGLQPWFKQQGIIFAEDLGCKSHLLTEIRGFPKFKHDDILDTLVDLMYEGKEASGDVVGREKFQEDSELTVYDRIENAQRAALGFEIDERSAVDALTGM